MSVVLLLCHCCSCVLFVNLGLEEDDLLAAGKYDQASARVNQV
jgi:hypothetical protein